MKQASGDEVEHRCRVCGVILTDENWYPSYRKKHDYLCKQCRADKGKKYRSENREEIRVWHKKHREDNKEQIKSRKKEYYEKNKDAINKRNMERYYANHDENRANMREHYAANRDEIRDAMRKHRADNIDEYQERERVYREKNSERIKANMKQYRIDNKDELKKHGHEYRALHGGRQMNENKECSLYLGVYIAEGMLSNLFKGVERMPNGNPGYDFICNKNKKIDVKSACERHVGNSVIKWGFRIKHNTTADYFLCIAFDNRTDLNPLYLWLIPGDVVNHLSVASISKTALHKWDAYKLPIDEVIKCCNNMRS